MQDWQEADMRINLSAPETQELKPRIDVAGEGGAGGKAVYNKDAQGLSGGEFNGSKLNDGRSGDQPSVHPEEGGGEGADMG